MSPQSKSRIRKLDWLTNHRWVQTFLLILKPRWLFGMAVFYEGFLQETPLF